MSQWIGTKSLRAQGVPGLDPAEQLRRLATDSTGEPWPSFAEALRETSGESMRASHWEILQVNVGYAYFKPGSYTTKFLRGGDSHFAYFEVSAVLLEKTTH